MTVTDAGPRAQRRWSLLHVAGWLVVVPLVLVALARVLAWDSRSSLVALNTLAPLLYVPAWLVAVLAAGLRRWALLAVAAAVMVAHVSFVLPELLAAEDVPAAAATAPTFRIFNANVLVGNRQVRSYADELGRSRPDVVVLQEATPGFLADLDATGALADLPHRISVPRLDPAAAFVASRWPLREHDVVSVGGRPMVMRATFTYDGRPIRLFAVHTVAPFGAQRQQWIEGLRAVGAAVAEERRPVLLAGDFNATWGHRSFRDLLDQGLTDAAAARGQAFQMTWPRNTGLPAFARIDHLMTTRELVTTRISTGVGRGSDHRPLIADVAFPRP